MIYPKCPRCNKDWVSKSPFPYSAQCYCIECNISYWNGSDGDDELLCLAHFLKKYDELSWDWRTGTCNYWVPSSTGNNDTTLPWMPIDISTTKLKLYLLFI